MNDLFESWPHRFDKGKAFQWLAHTGGAIWWVHVGTVGPARPRKLRCPRLPGPAQSPTKPSKPAPCFFTKISSTRARCHCTGPTQRLATRGARKKWGGDVTSEEWRGPGVAGEVRGGWPLEPVGLRTLFWFGRGRACAGRWWGRRSGTRSLVEHNLHRFLVCSTKVPLDVEMYDCVILANLLQLDWWFYYHFL